jgi:hypothetical protein
LNGTIQLRFIKLWVAAAMKVCYQCSKENPEEAIFCQFCASPLELKEFIASSIRQQIVSRDRSIMEADSALRVVERVWAIAKIAGSLVGICLLIALGLGAWKISDFWTAVSSAKQSVVET